MYLEDNNILFSIIIPTYQRAHLISETLDSIVGQNYTNWECIVIDDGSTDNTHELLNNYIAKDSRFQYYSRPENLLKGPNSCRNYGFQKSKGDYIKWFDSDDIMLEDCLSTIYEQFLKKDSDVVVSDIMFIDFNGIRLNRRLTYYSQNLIEDYLVGKIAFYTIGPTWGRKFLNQQKQLFDEKISNLDDWDFNLRMLYQDPKIKYIHKALIQYRIHSESLAHEIDKLNYKEICSEIITREKHLRLLRINKKADPDVLNKFIKNRYRYFFINAIQTKDINRYKYFKILLKKQFELMDFFGILKATFAFLVFSVFNKGYILLKKI